MACFPSPASSLPQIRGLSGGQKVKLVLGAAMWQQPHILVLDEPTNYLDRESLGAMASALKVGTKHSAQIKTFWGWVG